jgi:ferrous iron transport protein A
MTTKPCSLRPAGMVIESENEIRFHSGMAIPAVLPETSRDDEQSLADLRPGREARIVAIDGEGPIAGRLLDLGLVPGTHIRVVRRAPLGDPILYELRGYRIALRASEARLVSVLPRVETDA